MDITPLFKACVKTIRTKNKAFGLSSPVNADKSKILKLHSKSDFIIKSKNVLHQISRLRDFLLEHRKAYLNFSSHISNLPQMTDTERDKIDFGAQRIMNSCSNLIQDLKQETLQKKVLSQQLAEHQGTILELMKEYLREVCKIYSEQRAVRVKHAIEAQKLNKIEPSSPKKKIVDTTEVERKKISNSVDFYSEADDELTQEELKMFQFENDQLFNELNSLSEEVKQIESKVIKIAELQEIFTEKVLQQDSDVDRILSTTVGTTEYMKDANEQIRQAIQRNAGFRVWILFFLLVMSFSLLFLDWYND